MTGHVRGIERGIDKEATTALLRHPTRLPRYEQGVLRGILVDADGFVLENGQPEPMRVSLDSLGRR